MDDTHDIELYLIRHAETVMNVNQHLVGGRSNHTPLTNSGIKQSKRLGEALKRANIYPSKVFASPAVRTIDTARYSLSAMGLDIEPLVVDEIQELSHGRWEGKPRDEAYTDDVMADVYRLDKDFKFEGGESMRDVGERMHNWITETFADEQVDNRPQRYFVYTHGGSIRYLASHLSGWDRQQTFDIHIANTAVNLFIRRSGKWEVVYLNKDPATLSAESLSR